MKRIAATLIAGLFASAAFAQTTTPPAKATAPDSSMSPAVATAAASHDKDQPKTDAMQAKATKADKPTKAKSSKMGSGKHAANTDVAKDAKTDGAADSTTPAASK
jgi:hypothetical protein